MFAIVICLVFLMCTLTILSYVLCVLIVEGMSVVVNVMLSLISVMNGGGVVAVSACMSGTRGSAVLRRT